MVDVVSTAELHDIDPTSAAISALHQNTDIEMISNGIFTQALSTLKLYIFPISNGQYRSLNGIVDNHETNNWMVFFIHKCPIDEYVADRAVIDIYIPK